MLDPTEADAALASLKAMGEELADLLEPLTALRGPEAVARVRRLASRYAGER